MGDSSGRTKQSAPRSATPTKEQLIAELESLDTVQARIDCIAADLASKTNRYDALNAHELGELIDLEGPGNWPRCRYAQKPEDLSFESLDKPVAHHISAIAYSVPNELYALLEREAKAIINSIQSSDLTTTDIVNTIIKGLPEVDFPEPKPWPGHQAIWRVQREEPTFSEELGYLYRQYHDRYDEEEEHTDILSSWVESDLLPTIRERYRKKHPDRKATDEEQILAIPAFGPKEFFPLLREATNYSATTDLAWSIATELKTLPIEVLNRCIRSVKTGNPANEGESFLIPSFQEWFELESEDGGEFSNELRDLVERHLMPLFKESYYEEYPQADPDWEPEEFQTADIALAFTSVKASNGTELHFEVLVGDAGEAFDMCSPYDIEAGNGCDLSDYVQID
jgi:hypothetical protein